MLKNIFKAEQRTRKQESELKVKRVTIQVTEREKEIIQALAEEEGSTVSDYIRRITIYRQLDKFVS
ncbi:MAG: plasmid mobilization protein [Clostridium sp.]